VSALLERIQEVASGYPPWLVLGVGVLLLGFFCILLSKVMRVLGWLLALGGLLAGVWFGWQHWQRARDRADDPLYGPYEDVFSSERFVPGETPAETGATERQDDEHRRPDSDSRAFPADRAEEREATRPDAGPR